MILEATIVIGMLNRSHAIKREFRKPIIILFLPRENRAFWIFVY